MLPTSSLEVKMESVSSFRHVNSFNIWFNQAVIMVQCLLIMLSFTFTVETQMMGTCCKCSSEKYCDVILGLGHFFLMLRRYLVIMHHLKCLCSRIFPSAQI